MQAIHRFRLLAIVLASVAWPASPVPREVHAAEGKVIQVLRDYEGETFGGKRPAIVFWKWTAEQKANAAAYSSTEIVGDAAVGKQCLKLVVSERLPQPATGYRMIALGTDYLPPETDAVRLRVKVLNGRFTLSVGGPTVYFGHSDVLTQPVTLDAATHGAWSTIELSLNRGLRRNYRRSQWGHHAPIFYYTRWIQEPLGVEVAAGSAGEMLIDQIELIARGEGRPYPTFEPAQVQTVAPGIDFEEPAAMDRSFTVMTSTTDRPDFDREAHLIRKAWAPPQLARVAEGQSGRHSLEMVMTGAEEACFAGVQVGGVAEANAIALTIKAEYAGRDKPGVVLDFVAYAAPAEQRGAFPWDSLRPPLAWRNNREIAFTYYLNQKNPAAERATFGFYHTRRLAPHNEWRTLVLPLADFICCYGQGDMAAAFQQQKALAGDNVFALTFLSYFGQNAKPVRVLIDDIRFVKVPGTPQELRSFYQAAAVAPSN